MKTPIRLAILQALTAHLEGVTPANGYSHNLAGKVFRGRQLLGANQYRERPIVSILESPRPDIASFTGEWHDMRHEHWTLLLQGLVEDDKNNPFDPAYYLCAEVEQHLARIIEVRRSTGNPAHPDAHLLGGLITSMEIAPPVVRPPEDAVSASAFFFLPLRVGVAGATGLPYTSS